ncbi:RNA helicase [Acetobacter indonesiensis NRIC 0313]|uniref:RNA helicase n=1 Tax=Acetobacter indonesiensis TaxID=104101 RepID=A0A6N3T325_9PROT|nr:helicase-related protein [Acetobacter indonesiensis]MCG0995007.1 RNA helicase [Acetobacter indonesiensis]MCP1230236.1 RNA helicase [Acetobacter indonesiensis]OUI94451.1 RNA helicase [Acetobacter indonesiensis]GAN63462.1 RNA helicase [Acetobacter indonesiensis]GBQ56051.1 RNA helicase [Acetobacter indonesiensis NRIC 0313]
MTSEPFASPAREAFVHVTVRTGLEVEPKEEQEVLRRVARALEPGARDIPDETFRSILCVVRRKKRISRLVDLTRRSGRIWVTRDEIEQAVGTITQPEAGDADLERALAPVAEERLRSYAKTPKAVFEAIQADLLDTGRVLSPGQTDLLLMAIAVAFGLPEGDSFLDTARQEEAQRQKIAHTIERTAQEKRQQEEKRLQSWEESLVLFKDVPRILRCSHKEALRWIAENRLPVARKVRESGGRERWEFDPAELIALRDQLPEWRAGGLPVGSGGTKLQPDMGRKVANAVIARVAALDRYAAHFRTARSLNRRITLVTGPTNSGKSYTALNALAQAESGLALAPLRLLAHEFREALAARGVEASLATGEERIPVPSSRHLAATVEMCPFYNPVDVAVIDEAQMLFDTDRGAAWTAAIMGAPARHLYVLGAPDCIPMVRRIAELCGDPLDEISLERKSPLRAAAQPVKLTDLTAGDALIAFSRREVLDLRAALMQHGRRVAVVYGALSPEVRRAEAQRFNSGGADILIATDAIGMGLNLSIKRVVFAALKKFDGKQTRDLTVQEVKQIGGRAGRYGKHEVGTVAVLAGAGSPSFIRRQLEADAELPEDLRPFVQPDADIVKAVASEIGSESLYGVLSRIHRAVLRKDDPNYRLADMEQAFAIASALEGVDGLDLTTRWSYAMCPVDDRDNGIRRLVGWAADHAAGRRVLPPGTGRLPPSERASREELERAEKRHKRLVAWRWLALRFPDFYPDREEAEETTRKLNEWIESVLRQQSRTRSTGGSKRDRT